MSKGVIKYDSAGNPVCELCGQSYPRLMSHVRQVHNMTARDYKLKFSLDLKKGICSAESSRRTREKTLENYDTVIAVNLTQKGAKSRFKVGDPGRTKDKVSEQTRIRLRERLYSPEMQEVLKKSGHRLAKTGLGNATRWNQPK